MKLTLGTGTPIECDFIEVEGSVVKASNNAKRQGGKMLIQEHLVLAYHLRPGETIRRMKDGDYEVQL